MIRTAQIAKRGHISHKQNSLISHPSSSTFIDLQYLLDLAFQIGLLLVTITVKHQIGQPYVTILHVLSYLTLKTTHCYFYQSQNIESICQSHTITKNGRAWKNTAHRGD